MTKVRGLLIVGMLLCAKPTLAVPLSFESGLAAEGWASLGLVEVVGTVCLPPAEDLSPGGTCDPIIPTHGDFQALLTTAGATTQDLETFFGLASGFLTGRGYTQGSGLTRDFVLGAGDTWSFNWNFATPDFFGDAAWFVMDSTGTLLIEDTTVAVADRVSTGYQPFSFTAPRADTFLVGVGVFARDAFFNSYLAVDNFDVVPFEGQQPVGVPEPGTLLLLTAAWGTVFFSRRLFGAPKERA